MVCLSGEAEPSGLGDRSQGLGDLLGVMLWKVLNGSARMVRELELDEQNSLTAQLYSLPPPLFMA